MMFLTVVVGEPVGLWAAAETVAIGAEAELTLLTMAGRVGIGSIALMGAGYRLSVKRSH